MLNLNKLTTCYAALLLYGLLSSAASAAGGSPLFPAVDPTPPRTCTTASGVVIVAGLNGDPTAIFPRIVDCSIPGACADPNLSGSYLQWDYSFTFNYPGMNLQPNNNTQSVMAGSQILLTVSNDSNIYAPNPPISNTIGNACGVQSTIKNADLLCESQILPFPLICHANTNINTISYLTPLGVAPRLTSAGVKRAIDHSADLCLIAGAGTITVNQVNQATIESQVVSTPGCNVNLVKDANNRVVSAELTDPSNTNCQIDTAPAAYICDSSGGQNPTPINCKIIVSNLPENGLSSEGSCQYAYTNSAGGKTTIKCTTCCVQASNRQCVLKSSLSNPAKQCTSTSYP